MATNRTKYLYHVTHKNNWYPIGVQGLLCDYSSGAKTAIWLVTEGRIAWACRHIRYRDNIHPNELIVVKVRVRRKSLRRNRVRGVWYHISDIYPCRIESISSVFDYWREKGGNLLKAKCEAWIYRK